MKMSMLLGGLAVAAASFSAAMGQDKLVKVDGSSTVYPVTEAVAEDFQHANKDIKVTVGISGTGGGFKKFVRGETDITDASRPIMAAEMKLAKENGIEYLELPIAFDALTVVVSPKATWVDSMTVAELKKLWEPAGQGKVMKWSDVRAGWPEEKMELYGPGSDSGTFDYFTEAVVGKAKSSRGDFTASEDDNVLVRGVEGSKNALGYFGYAYYAAHQSKLKAVKINWEGHTKEAVGPSLETVVAGTYAPLSRPLFIYVNKKSLQEKPYVKAFVSFYLQHGANLATEVKYVPLPSEAYETCKERVGKLEAGTAFGGEPEVGLSITELMKRPLSLEIKAVPAAKPWAEPAKEPKKDQK